MGGAAVAGRVSRFDRRLATSDNAGFVIERERSMAKQQMERALLSWLARWSGVAALLAFIAAVIGFGLALPGFEQTRHPVALLGARGLPHALAFNLCGLLLPGTLATVQAAALLRLRPDRAGWPLRIGLQLVLLAALAFAAIGVFALDPADLNSRASQYHATAWLLWLTAFGAGGLLWGSGLWAGGGDRVLAGLSVAAAVVVVAAGLGPAEWLHPALAQRVAFLAWLGWLVPVGWRAAGRAE